MPWKYPKSVAVNTFIASMVLSALCLAFHEAPAEEQTSDGRRDHRTLLRIEMQSLGLPPVPFPDDNPPTAVKIRLGREPFFDRRLSHNGTLSCAMCHVPEQGFTGNEIATSVGHEGKTLRRNALTLLNVAFMGPLFHDGRETSLETQVISPLLDPDEMANPAIGYLIDSGALKRAQILTVSGRISFEIVIKAFRAGIPYLLGVSAPSSFAVTIGQRFGMSILGFCREQRATVYTNPQNVTV